MPAIRVVILAFEGVSLFQLSIPAMAFGVVYKPSDFPAYDVRYCAQNPGWLCSDQGIVIEVNHGLDAMDDANVIIIPAWPDPNTPAPIEIIDALKQAHAKEILIVGLCLGAFVLGDAGLLDGREATTHWMARDIFAQRFPLSHFRPDVLYVDDGNIITSAGTVAAIDCCLHLVRQRHGAEVSNRIARLLVTPPHRSGGQVQYIERPIPQLPTGDRLVNVLEWARQHLSENLSLDLLAEVANMSRRTFTRRFKETTGTTVTQWLNSERVVRAQALLESTDLSIEQIAYDAGFGTPLSFRQQFNHQLGMPPSEYRRTFSQKIS